MVYSESTIKHIAEIGLLACEQNRLDDAQIIFTGVAAIATDEADLAAANLGLASTKIAAGKFEEGIRLLSSELEKDNYQNVEALTLLVYALSATKRHEEAKVMIAKLRSNPAFKNSMAEEIISGLEG